MITNTNNGVFAAPLFFCFVHFSCFFCFVHFKQKQKVKIGNLQTQSLKNDGIGVFFYGKSPCKIPKLWYNGIAEAEGGAFSDGMRALYVAPRLMQII